MGCCGSKDLHDEEDINTPLLNNINGENQMNYQSFETIDAQREQEFWNNIIYKTTQNLIDISNAQTEPLQGSEVDDREGKYYHLLEQVRPKIQHKSLLIDNNPNTIDILSNAKPNGGMTDGEIDFLYQTIDEIQDALQHIEVKPAGDIVVYLTMTDNSTIKAY